MRVAFILDGAPVEVEVDGEQMLVEVLRGLGRLSVRETCGIGVCGAAPSWSTASRRRAA
jgi:aerobic-type carbon monoxide dehydrogenase small subunit (CoxS/CutS family)